MRTVSVVIPTFNAAQYIGLAVESVLAQSVKIHEICVVDDGSTDQTQQVLEKFGKRIRSFKQDNQGPSAARNRALDEVTGDVIIFLDADDTLDRNAARALIVTVGTTPCFAVNAVSYTAVIAALFAVRPLTSNRARKGSGGVRAGLRYARSRQQLWLPLAMMSLVGLLAFNFAVVLPFFATEDFHGTGGTYGLLTTMLSVGSIAGSFGVSLIRHPRRIYLVAAALAFGVCLAGTAAAPNVPVACVALAAAGAAAFSFVTLTSTTLQLHSSQAYRGRIMALFVFIYLGTTPIGSILTGWVDRKST